MLAKPLSSSLTQNSINKSSINEKDHTASTSTQTLLPSTIPPFSAWLKQIQSSPSNSTQYFTGQKHLDRDN
ncbi:hypothetical protein AMTR_s00046p00186330 [Amborella trichopoda]|uniref:Uncharacterized protein n=1 Tax=Amborella trichopoda TaxID=13333 RepID=U5D6I3_AMBTC|nr:hypothetical protein AMTR_s00046p00186330 [Amborella trichopoda]